MRAIGALDTLQRRRRSRLRVLGLPPPPPTTTTIRIPPTQSSEASFCVPLRATLQEADRARRSEPASECQHWTWPIRHRGACEARYQLARRMSAALVIVSVRTSSVIVVVVVVVSVRISARCQPEWTSPRRANKRAGLAVLERAQSCRLTFIVGAVVADERRRSNRKAGWGMRLAAPDDNQTDDLLSGRARGESAFGMSDLRVLVCGSVRVCSLWRLVATKTKPMQCRDLSLRR